MKTKEQINEELIQYYKIRVKELEGQLAKSKAEALALTRSFRHNPADKWYFDYLMRANASLERECDERQNVINQYQKHYQKFGRFYNDYERSRGLSDADILGDSDNAHRGD